MAGLDKFFQIIMEQINNLIPIVIILKFQKGVRYTFGKYSKILDPGIHFKFPYLQIVLKDNVVDTTTILPTQSIITEDKKEVIVKAVIGYCIRDIGKFYNKVYDTKSAVLDIAQVVVKSNINANKFDDICTDPITFGDLLKSELQKQVGKYGIKINFISLTDFTASRSYRLFNETSLIGQ